jgi:hypothetical protein
LLDTHLKAFTDAAADSVARAIAGVQKEAERAEQLRQAEYRAFFAEQRETVSGLIRKVEEKLAEVKDGKDGERGEKGEKGDPGIGEQGPAGRDGNDGSDGRDGADADMDEIKRHAEELIAKIPAPKDGITPEVDFNMEGNMGVLSFDYGETKQEFEIPLPYAGEAKGLFDPEATYRAMDVVSFNGSEWRAKRDDPGELPGEGWMLSASKGKRGDRGERGLQGMVGKDGKDGASPIELKFDADKMEFVMALDDGNVLEADFYPVAKAIRGE